MHLDENKIPEEFKKLAKDFSDNGFITTNAQLNPRAIIRNKIIGKYSFKNSAVIIEYI